ncbi:HEAT repeat domain-containing protein [Verrucosispora sp. WMMD1129]|uniref:caspase, EACC1-associated type n=1 Tax=Verrucosispora sp. WMMD1129 TaxID=3016093 RepID=UPI00249A985E|nr:HEAT repeat domain-containing protein [Verrucosispora sp. WMMD1129]WFE44106.1 HEAT repeat domain-containing protein [Verrucosispora sp. WMMD1129]
MYKALLICNSDYGRSGTLPFLRGPEKDGNLLAAALTDPDRGMFTDATVRPEQNLTSAQMQRTINEFFRSASPEDTLLFYFSGHGRSELQKLYLCGVDTERDLIPGTAVGNDTMNAILQQCVARTKIFILDCCDGGAFKGDNLAEQFAGRGRFVLTAAAATELAKDAELDGQPSPFTAALVDGLLGGASVDNDGNVTLATLYDYLHATLTSPRPGQKFDGYGRIAIARRPAPAVGEVTPPADPQPTDPTEEALSLLERPTSGTAVNTEQLAQFRANLRPDIAAEMPPALNTAEFLHRAHLMRNGRLTYAGALLFGEDPTAVVPTAMVTCVHFKGSNRDEWYAREELRRTVPEQIVQARNFVAQRTAQGETFTGDSMTPVPVNDYPMIAVREVIANALAHRDYEHRGMCVHVRVFDDRVEIVNPGSWHGPELPDGEAIPISQLRSESDRRNFHFARVLTWMRLVEGEGSGIPRAVGECQRIGAPEPTVVQTGDRVMVTIYPRALKATTKVYVSSTFPDLTECRRAVHTAARRLNVEDVAMESYVAESRPPLEASLRAVARSDLYIGLFAWRYGFVPAGHDQSITELEYREALRLGKPCLIFLLADDAPWPATMVDRGEAGERIEALRTELRGRHLIAFFRGPEDLATQVTAALANFLAGTQPPEADDKAIAESLRGYFLRLRQRYGGLDLEALSGPGYRRIDLGSVFVEPIAREEVGPGATASAVPLFELLSDPGRRTVMLLGAPGAGKSTVAQYLALALAEPHREPRLAPLRGHVPLLVPLRSYAAPAGDGRREGILDHLDHLHRSEGLGLPRSVLRALLDAGRPMIFIFDGLDELFDPRQREAVTGLIAAFAAEYPSVRIVVTSRPVEYSQRILAEAGFHHLTLDPLNDAQIADFLSNWYAVEAPDDPAKAEPHRKRLRSAIRDSPAIRALAGNPLLLTALLSLRLRPEQPRNRWQLYDHLTDVLLDRWDQHRHLSPTRHAAAFVDVADKKQMLGRLAYLMQSQGATRLDRDELDRVFESYLEERYGLSRVQSRQVIGELIDEFRVRDFMLVRYDDSRYGFTHRTLLEWFCARDIVRQHHEGQAESLLALFAAHWADQSWWEVLQLVAGAVPPALAGRLIQVLSTEVNRPWPADRFTEPPWNLVLAVQCLAQLRIGPAVARPAYALLRQLILLIEHGVSTGDEATAVLIEDPMLPVIRTLGTDWPGREAYPRWYRRRGFELTRGTAHAEVAARLATLLGAPRDGIQELLDPLADEGDHQAQLALVARLAETAISEAGLPVERDRLTAGRARLIGYAVNSADPAVRRVALDALVSGYGVDDALVNLLHHRARSDEDPPVRALAVRALGHHDDGDVHDTLCERLAKDVAPPVVEAAAIALLDQPGNAPLVRRQLLDRIHEDESGAVRSIAVRLLSRHFPDAGLMLELVRHDPDPDTRLAALEALVRTTDHSAAVLDTARDDPAPAVRLVAVHALANGSPAVLADAAEDLIRDADPAVRQAVVSTLVRTGTRDHLALERIREDPDPQVIREAATGLFGWQSPVRNEVVAALLQRGSHDVDPAVRAAAVELLASSPLPAEQSRAFLLDRVNDPDPTVLAAAAGALLAADGRPTVAPLLRTRATSDDPTIRRAVVELLSRDSEGDSDTLALLVERASTDPDVSVRRVAVAGLVDKGRDRPQVVDLFRDLFTDGDPGVRRTAARALAQHHPTEEFRDLLVDQAAHHPDPALRRLAEQALTWLPGTEIDDLPDRTPSYPDPR